MAALLTASGSAGAETARFGVTTEGNWTDNVFGTFDNEVDDVYGRISPWAEVADNDGRVTGRLRYQPSYEYYVDQDGLRGFDHDVSGNVTFHVTRATQLRISDRFARYRSLSRFNEQAEPGEDIAVTGFRERLKRNRLALVLDHSFNPRDSLALTASHTLLEFSNDANADRENIRVGATLRRSLSERTAIGTTFSWSQREAQRSGFEQRKTNSYNLAASASHTFSPTLNVSLSVGPAFIDSEDPTILDSDPMTDGIQRAITNFPLIAEGDGPHFVDADSCPTDADGDHVFAEGCELIDPALNEGQQFLFRFLHGNNVRLVPVLGSLETDNSRFTYFASVTINKQWEKARARLTYSRSTSDSSQVAAVADIVAANLEWHPAKRWTAQLTGSFERQEAANDVPFLVPIVENVPSQILAFPSVAQFQSLKVVEASGNASVDFLRAFFRLSYQLNRRSNVFFQASWRQQKINADFFLQPKSERWVAGIGLAYRFDPVPF